MNSYSLSLCEPSSFDIFLFFFSDFDALAGLATPGMYFHIFHSHVIVDSCTEKAYHEVCACGLKKASRFVLTSCTVCDRNIGTFYSNLDCL